MLNNLDDPTVFNIPNSEWINGVLKVDPDFAEFLSNAAKNDKILTEEDIKKFRFNQELEKTRQKFEAWYVKQKLDQIATWHPVENLPTYEKNKYPSGRYTVMSMK